MENLWIYVIPLIASLVIGFIAGKRQELGIFLRELGEALIATDEYLAIDSPTTEDTERFRKEWFDVIRAGGGLFKKIIAQARKMRK